MDLRGALQTAPEEQVVDICAACRIQTLLKYPVKDVELLQKDSRQTDRPGGSIVLPGVALFAHMN